MGLRDKCRSRAAQSILIGRLPGGASASGARLLAPVCSSLSQTLERRVSTRHVCVSCKSAARRLDRDTKRACARVEFASTLGPPRNHGLNISIDADGSGAAPLKAHALRLNRSGASK